MKNRCILLLCAALALSGFNPPPLCEIGFGIQNCFQGYPRVLPRRRDTAAAPADVLWGERIRREAWEARATPAA